MDMHYLRSLFDRLHWLEQDKITVERNIREMKEELKEIKTAIKHTKKQIKA